MTEGAPAPEPPEPPPPVEAPRKSGIVTALAVLNVVFGLLCGCVGLVQGAFVVVFLDLPSLFDGLQSQIDSARVAREKRFDEQLAKAEDEQAKATIEANRAAWRRGSPVIDITSFGRAMGDPRVKGYMVSYAALSAVGNLLLLVSGAGLLGRAAWGRKLAIATAGSKIVGEAALMLFGLAAFGPVLEATDDLMRQIAAAAPPGQAVQLSFIGPQMRMMALLQTGFGLAVASIYPTILLLVLLSRSVTQEFRDWEEHRSRGGA